MNKRLIIYLYRCIINRVGILWTSPGLGLSNLEETRLVFFAHAAVTDARLTAHILFTIVNATLKKNNAKVRRVKKSSSLPSFGAC